MKILVTGATGFVGAHIVRKLLKAGHPVRILRRPHSSLKALEGMSVETAIGDITDRDSVFRAVAGCETVFHVAGHVSFWEGANEIQNKINIDGTRNVVDACLEHKVKRLIHTSSIAAIGFAPDGKLGDETLEYNWGPYHLNYCDSKRGGELEIQKGIKKGLDAVIVNPAVIFGPGDLNLNAGAMVFQTAKGKVPFYFDGGCCVCDVEDVAEGHIQAWLKGKKGERYILGGDNYSWRQLMELIASVVGVSPPQKKISAPLLKTFSWIYGFVSRFTKKEPVLTPELARISLVPCYFSSEKAKRELGYTVTPFRQTVQKTYDWYKANRYLK